MSAVGSALARSFGERRQLLKVVANKLSKYINGMDDRTVPVLKLKGPEEIYAAFDEVGIPLSLSNEPEQQPASMSKLEQSIDCLLENSVRTGHPLFFNQLYGRADAASIAADWVSVATNTNCHTYEVAPVYTLMEMEVLAKIASTIGGEFANSHDGLMVPGGSLANMYGMHLARNVSDSDFATRGAAGGPVHVAFTSDQSHYSYLKSARVTGVGSDNLIYVDSDAAGRMCPSALEEAITAAKDAGKKPFFVGGKFQKSYET